MNSLRHNIIFPVLQVRKQNLRKVEAFPKLKKRKEKKKSSKQF